MIKAGKEPCVYMEISVCAIRDVISEVRMVQVCENPFPETSSKLMDRPTFHTGVFIRMMTRERACLTRRHL